MDAHKPPPTIDLQTVPEDQRDAVWFEHYYQGDTMPQLTVRAVLMGMFLGGIMSLSNLYVGLKTGWGLGVAITSCILSYAIWEAVLKLGLAKTRMSVLENNCMQSTASSAGSSTGGTMVSAIAAYLMITGKNMPFWVLFWWTAFLALLGVAMAVPMKRQMINREQLPFPSGTAAAETLRSLHAEGGDAILKARALFWSMGIGGVIGWIINGHPGLILKLREISEAPTEKLEGFSHWLAANAYTAIWRIGHTKETLVPAAWDLPFKINGKDAGAFGLAAPIDPLMIAAGALVGLRTSISMAIGAGVLYAFFGPWLDNHGIFTEMKALGALSSDAVTAGNIRKWGLWIGASLMVASGLTSFAFQWRSIARALSGVTALLPGSKKSSEADPLAAIEVPNSWMAVALLISGGGCIYIMHSEFGVAYGWGLVAVALSFVLSLVACRATGETDTTPIGAMGKVTQLFYGYFIPGQQIPNLMTAGVTAGAAGSAADLLVDLKSGYLLGANPRQQTIAQALGIIAGTLVVVPVWSYVLVPTPDAIGNEQFPAPAAEVWKSVAELLSKGLSSLHPTLITGMGIAAAVGIGLTVIEQLVPSKVKRWLPSASGLGLAFVIQFHDSIAFLIGAILAWAFTKYNEQKAETYTVPVSSGIIAGSSLMGIAVALLAAAGILAG